MHFFVFFQFHFRVIPCQINRFLANFPWTPSDSFEIWHTCRNCLETNILHGQCRKKVIQMPMEVPVEHSTPSTSEEEEQLKSNDTTSVVASGNGTTDMNLSLYRTDESTFVVSLLFSCSFFLFSSETLE